MKKIAIILAAASLAVSAVGTSAVAAPGSNNAGGRSCSFGGYSAKSPGQWFQYVLSPESGWNIPGATSIVAFLNYWWDVTGGTNNAETVADFIQRDCSN